MEEVEALGMENVENYNVILAFAFMYQLLHAGIDHKYLDIVQCTTLFSRLLV